MVFHVHSLTGSDTQITWKMLLFSGAHFGHIQLFSLRQPSGNGRNASKLLEGVPLTVVKNIQVDSWKASRIG